MDGDPSSGTSGPLSVTDPSLIHTPVLLRRCVELLAPALEGTAIVLVDATLGMGGHAEALLERFPDMRLVGLDRDADALHIAKKRLSPCVKRVNFVKAVYDQLPEVLTTLGINEVSGILFDLGVSSLQLDRVDRGFSYSKDAPLDMRMDPSQELTAENVITTYSEAELCRIFREYGEEKLAARYAHEIITARSQKPITSSGQLVHILTEVTPIAVQRSGHPAKRVFQALRIEVNHELAVLERAIPAALDSLNINGRIVVMAYHSLEDRIVKRIFAAASSSSTPERLPVELPEHEAQFRLLTRGAEMASDEEKIRNPRASSVRLRAIERIRKAA
jgi:16S rRNA (cytosine1402-N4)-methyltransferase